MPEITVKAKKVKVGDFLPGLDNGYVFEPPERDPYAVFGDSRYPHQAGNESTVLITFHDAEGEENYLVCGKNMPITVRRD